MAKVVRTIHGLYSNQLLNKYTFILYYNLAACPDKMLYIQYCAKVMQTPVDKIRRNSWLFDEFLTETKLRRHFREFSRHVLF